MAMRKMLDRLASTCAGHEAMDVRQVQDHHVHPASEQMPARRLLPVLLRCVLRCVHLELMAWHTCISDLSYIRRRSIIVFIAFIFLIDSLYVVGYRHTSLFHFMSARWPPFARVCASSGRRASFFAGR